ncbi:uncharacterized protein BJX67DRAFT_247507 [Aspergillus lucknowensis]|uniref:Uncharacterized protein n=1 Tax=Aspergillus lucknowensis TaxID=176173 RepID=A0ABR4M1Y7_9EURO
MGQGVGGRTTNPRPDQSRTPDKPVSSSKLKRAPARLGSLPDTPAKTPASAPSTASTAKSWKRSSTRGVQDQPTLTQIDFVTVSQNPDSDDEPDYIGKSDGNSREVIEIKDDDEDDLEEGDDDPDYKPSFPSKSTRARSARSDSGPFKTRISSNKNDGDSNRGSRKGGEKKYKEIQKDDKTLTQMNYVRRILIGSDDEATMEYAYITPKRKDSGRQIVKSDETVDEQQDQNYNPGPSSYHKKRKLNSRFGTKESSQTAHHGEARASCSPATPRKGKRTEIPSSQSPESPGIAFITASQFRDTTLSSRTRGFRTLNDPSIKGESPDLDDPNDVHELWEQMASADPKPSFYDSKSSPKPSLAPEKSIESTPLERSTLHGASAQIEPSRSEHRPSSTRRTVIYETDAETNYSDLEDDLPNVPGSSPHKGNEVPNDRVDLEAVPNSQDIESQELPLPPLPDQDVEFGPLTSQSNLLSDASVCYRRLHPVTQFPLDPVPNINTQKMAELFPEESNGLYTLTSPSQLSTPPGTRLTPHSKAKTEPEDENHSQPDSQGVDKTSAEVVPESSPVEQHESSSRHGPATQDVVVQVESSQPVDRMHRQGPGGRDSGPPRGILSRSQILTSSVMESVQIPTFWMNSQDSVGEPYSLPDT